VHLRDVIPNPSAGRERDLTSVCLSDVVIREFQPLVNPAHAIADSSVAKT